ncbi:biotin-dependent carboxyltransferase family protein [Brenneria populi]|uniref:Biotin-dependent carboxyltransferase family protein n=1 Tax=Brenneria populi TaxID=1505588 RepID=A0ABU6JPT0_9GAMM|nr:biotin-dependent carboxyltransferase family protein [Brenneria populi Li et al. 2015]
MNVMHIERPGLLTTFQDGGRRGFQKYGVPVGGPMDEWAYALANALVGNAPDAAVLECTLTGPSLRFTENTLIALCGARMQVSAAGVALPYDRAILLRRGTLLEVGPRQRGARLYIAVRGVPSITPVLGSRSTNLRAGFGGLDGRALAAGDAVEFAPVGDRLPIEMRMVQSALPVLLAPEVGADSAPSEETTLRMVRGSHWAAFDAAAQSALTANDFVMQAESDRQGLRLQGRPLGLRAPLEVVSEATVFGTVQVPPDGNPIVLMADRQSAGGYPKIATVAGVDLPALAQRVPGEALRFSHIEQDAAETLWLARCRKLAALAEKAAQALGR